MEAEFQSSVLYNDEGQYLVGDLGLLARGRDSLAKISCDVGGIFWRFVSRVYSGTVGGHVDSCA